MSKKLLILSKRRVISSGLMVLGATYFSYFSSLEISPFFKGYVAIIPVQILALLYIFYLKKK